MTDRELFAYYLSYDPETGVIKWIRKKGPSMPGRVLKPNKVTGYVTLQLNGVSYPAHRVAWLLTHGKWPDGEIDHIDGIKVNNRLANLRDVPHKLNSQNVKTAQRNNKSGFLGVSARKNGQWVAQLCIDGYPEYLGLFDTPEQAHEAYLAAKREYHAGCTI